jgi:hypothetical protein
MEGMPKLGPNIKKLASMKLARMAVTLTGGDAKEAHDRIKDIATDEMVMVSILWALAMVDYLKTSEGCPYTEDEDIAGDVIQRIQKMGGPLAEKPTPCHHCGKSH